MRSNTSRHFAVLSVGTPSSSASTPAATADGASPTTDPSPCFHSQARRNAPSVVVFPVPAGPTRTSTVRPETAIRASASRWSGPSVRPSLSGSFAKRSIVSSASLGPAMPRALAISRSSAASNAVDENSVECFGRNLVEPSARRNSAGVTASSGGVSLSDACSAASAIMPTMTSRSSLDANLSHMDCRAASAMRFQRRQVERFSPTVSRAAIMSSGTSSARNNRTPELLGSCCHATLIAHAVASSPRITVARSRHSLVRSSSDRTSFSGRVASVASCNSLMT